MDRLLSTSQKYKNRKDALSHHRSTRFGSLYMPCPRAYQGPRVDFIRPCSVRCLKNNSLASGKGEFTLVIGPSGYSFT